ncbi:MAG: FAD-dependent oxidoreductase [Desulfobacterales bacterium]|nr:MAG: FAD-dependent oxidoreductase [Desulfobacterales bacterium]
MPANPIDILILGTGPAGITAALYGQRMGLQAVVLGDMPGGSVYMIETLSNFPGFLHGISGTEFGVAAFQQAREEGAHFPMARLERLNCAAGVFSGIDTNGQEHVAPSAIVATGRVPRRLAVSNAKAQGIHFCSVCDGPLFRGRNAVLAVVGSDNAAGQHALTLSRIAQKVWLVCRSRTLKMDAAHAKLIRARQNIELLLNTAVTGYKGREVIEGIIVLTEEKVEKELAVDGVFLAIGWQPNTQMLNFEVAMTAEGYLRTDTRLMTSVPGLFAAGDVRDTDLRQVLTACADGARAAQYAAEFLAKTTPR